MSILAAAEPVTTVQLVFAGLMIAFGLGLAYAIGAFRPGTVNGPVRIARDESIAPVLFVFLAGLVTWFGLQSAYGVYRALSQRAPGDAAPPVTLTLDAQDYAILGTVPFIVGLVVLMVGDPLAAPSLPRKLGWTLDRLPGGFLRGVLGIIIIYPILTGGGIWLEALYQAIGYEHPTEHELLKVLGESRDPILRAALVVGATLLAPLFEEFFFRGHFQTILLRAFARRARPIVAPMPPPLPPQSLDAAPNVAATFPPIHNGPLPLPLPDPPAPPSAAARWAAIAVASFVFAVLHPAWTWPLIFVLAMGMGYAYERTGNLWVPVFIHLFFNSINTMVTLLSHRFEPAAPPI